MSRPIRRRGTTTDPGKLPDPSTMSKSLYRFFLAGRRAIAPPRSPSMGPASGAIPERAGDRSIVSGEQLGHRLAELTIANTLKNHGVPPSPERPTSWRTFLRAHADVIAATDFFTTEVWTWRGLVTYYTVFAVDLASRRVQILGSTRFPEALFMQQVVRTLTMPPWDEVDAPRLLICDRDQKWSPDVRRRLQEAGLRVVRSPERAPNANASAERFVRSIKEG